MKTPILVVLIAFFSLAPMLLLAQDAVKRRLPLAVSHLSQENNTLLRRKAAPRHNIFSRVLCFNKVCRGFIGWRKRQRSMRFKGYKDGGKIPRPPKPRPIMPAPQIPKDSALVKSPAAPQRAADSLLTTREQIFILDEVLFEVNSAQLNRRFTYKLDSLVKFLVENKDLNARISGHTDNTGTESFNLRLSEERASSVAEYLIKKDIEIFRISYDGYGSAKPMASNETGEGRRKNRRVEILVSED